LVVVSWKKSVDLKIPGPDGLEVYRTVRQSGSNMPMLMLTARDAHEDGVTGPDTGAELEQGMGSLFTPLISATGVAQSTKSRSAPLQGRSCVSNTKARSSGKAQGRERKSW
jgi:CheY-like chemotaxis protein